jgi:autotransporter-associated beta strand protein
MHHTYQPGAAICPLPSSKISTQSLWIPAKKPAAPAKGLLLGLIAAMFLLSSHDLMAATYFSDAATGDPTSLTVWTNSVGVNPGNFTSGDTFIILSGANLTIGAGETWTVNATTAGTAATVQINSGGTLTFNLGTSQSELYLGGNFVQNGTLAGTATSATGIIDFSSGSGTWTGSGSVANAKLSVVVDSGATLNASGMNSGFTLKSANTVGLTINGALNTGTLTISGNGNGSAFFTLGGSGTLITATTSANGLPGVFTGFSAGRITLPVTASYVFDGTAAQVTGTTANNATMPTEVSSLTVSNSAGVTLSSAMQVDATLALIAGTVTGNVTVSSGGTITGGSSSAFLNGQLTVSFTAPSLASFTFPVGTAGAYSPVSIANFTDPETGTLTASATAGQNPNQGSSSLDETLYINRYWTLTGSGFTSPTYDFTGTFVAGDIQPGVNTANLLVEMWNGSTWVSPTGSSSTSTTATGTGFNTSFGQFAAGDPLVLPVLNSTTASAITNTSATLGATVTTNGGSSITDYGIVWGTSSGPTTANNKIQFGTSVTPPSTFTVNAAGLPVATTIYYRGYATSARGTGYSTNGTFLTLANMPTTQATGASGSSLQNGNLTFSWTRGNGADCIVLVSAGSAVNAAPVSGTTYTASATFGNGTQIGSGNYVAFIGTGNTVTLTGLSASTTYYVAVFELNGSGGSQNYLTTSPATANQTTVAVPVATITWTGSADINWNNANNWSPNLIPDVGTFVSIPVTANQPSYTNPMVAVSFGSMTNAGILTIATNGFNSGAVFLNNPSGGAKLLVTNSGVMNVNGNVAMTSNSVAIVSSGGSLTASGQLIIGSNPTGGTSGLNGVNGSYYGVVTNTGGLINVASTGINPGNANANSLFVINGGTNILGAVTVERSSSGNYPVGTEGLAIYGGLVTMSGLNVGGGGGTSWLAALIAGGIVTNNGSVFVNQATASRGSLFSQTAGLFVVTNLVNPNPTVASSLNVYSVTGGTNIVGGITFGASGGAGSIFFTNSAAMYVGSLGISANSGSSLTAALNSGGLFGATANWTDTAAMTLGGAFTFQAADPGGNAYNITLAGALNGNGAMNKTGGGTLTLSATNTYSGATIISAGTLALGAGGSLTSPSVLVGAGSTFDVSARGGSFSPASTQTISGFGNVNGLVTATAGTIQPGSNSLTGTLTFNSGLAESGNAANQFVLSSNPSGPGNDLISVTGNLTLAGTNSIQVSGSLPNGANYPLIQYSGSLTGGVTNFTLSGAIGYLTNVANTIVLHTLGTVRGPTNIVWAGSTTNDNWDTTLSKNWLNAGASDYFVSGDNVLFNNQARSNLLVNVVGSVMPGSVVVNTSSNFVFTGAGSIDGGGSLTMSNGMLTILTTNSYSGPTIFAGGILSTPNLGVSGIPSGIGAAGPSSANLIFNGGQLNYTGGSVSTDHGMTFTNGGGTIDVLSGTTLTLNGGMVGNGGLTLIDSGTVVLTGANSYTGGTTISNGTLTLNNASGAGTGGINFAGGTLSLTVGSQPTYANNLTVLANSTLNSAGGNNNIASGAWTGNTNVTLNVVISGSGTFTVGGSMTNFYGKVELGTDGGFFRFNGSGNTMFGGPNTTFDLGTYTNVLEARNPATIAIGALEGGAGTLVTGPSSTAGTLIWAIGSSTNNPSTTYYGTIKDNNANENSGILKIGTGTLTLAGSSTYTAGTTVDSGNLLISGSISGAGAVTVNGGTLGGSGSIGGAVTVQSGAILAPGEGISTAGTTLTINNNLTLNDGCTNIMQVSHNNQNSDQVVSSGTINYGGTLTVVTNAGDAPFAMGDTFTLFNSTSASYGGSFSATNLPPLSAGLTWNTSNLSVNGTVSVVTTAPPSFSGIQVSGSDLVLNAINGTPGGPVTVLSSTNLTVPLASWTVVTAGNFDGSGNFSYTVSGALSSGLPQQYYILRQ